MATGLASGSCCPLLARYVVFDRFRPADRFPLFKLSRVKNQISSVSFPIAVAAPLPLDRCSSCSAWSRAPLTPRRQVTPSNLSHQPSLQTGPISFWSVREYIFTPRHPGPGLHVTGAPAPTMEGFRRGFPQAKSQLVSSSRSPGGDDSKVLQRWRSRCGEVCGSRYVGQV